MPCLLALLALAVPRLVIVLVWLFGNHYFGRAYETTIWPVLGFFFMPLTTLAYAFAMNQNHHSVNSYYLVLVVAAVLLDLGLLGGGGKASRRRRRRRQSS
jgi:4-amino-4-deoxy-L-arabinose transferase-like glycosyltransferase